MNYNALSSVLDLGLTGSTVVHYRTVVNYNDLSVLDLGQRERIVVHYRTVVNTLMLPVNPRSRTERAIVVHYRTVVNTLHLTTDPRSPMRVHCSALQSCS